MSPSRFLRMENCQVVAQRTEEKNGYTAVQLGAGVAKVKNTSKALRGHFALPRSSRRPSSPNSASPRQHARCRRRITAEPFRRRPAGRRDRHLDRQGLPGRHEAPQLSAVFAPRTACPCRTVRTVRPVTARTRARSSRARRWPVTWAQTRVTTQNLEVVSTDDDRGLILVRGAVPGSKGAWILVRDAVKAGTPADAPRPAGIRAAK
jgi:large subunit ribosomal protein L3